MRSLTPAVPPFMVRISDSMMVSVICGNMSMSANEPCEGNGQAVTGTHGLPTVVTRENLLDDERLFDLED